MVRVTPATQGLLEAGFAPVLGSVDRVKDVGAPSTQLATHGAEAQSHCTPLPCPVAPAPKVVVGPGQQTRPANRRLVGQNLGT
jgi:hypothetical protein